MRQGGRDLYVRWTLGPADDLRGGIRSQTSKDSLTGVTMPGLSANPLRVERWWGERSTEFWIARRIFDYRHLRFTRDAAVRPWLLLGTVRGRGPDNEPLVWCRRALAWINDDAVRRSEELISQARGAPDWGPMQRAAAAPTSLG